MCVALIYSQRNAHLEDVEGYVGFLLVDDERRAEADGVFAAAEQQKAIVEGEVDDSVAERAGRFARDAVLDDLDCEHEAAAAGVANDSVLRGPGFEAFEGGCADR